MRKRWVVIFCFILCLVAPCCYFIAGFYRNFAGGYFDHLHKYEEYYFDNAAFELKRLQYFWNQNGRPAQFDISRYEGTAGTLKYENYTNVITVSNNVFHCRFSARRVGLPFGMMVITCDGTTIWINDKDHKITIEPEKNGVDGKNEK